MIVQLLLDNPKSWMVPHAKKLHQEILKKGIQCHLIHEHKAIQKGDILFLLSCEKILKKLNFNQHNIVIHASDLPQGKGWSPLTWQILEGKNEIIHTMFEATEKVDAGVIYSKVKLKFEGHELLRELQDAQGQLINEMVLDFIHQYPHNQGIEQKGQSTYYPRRRPKDSELDISKTIEEQFNLLRVCDNDQYPAFFIKNGVKYVLKIEKI